MGVLDSLLGGGLIGGLGSVITSGINFASQQKTNETAIDLANTAVQRRAKDMEAAGINPIMAAGQPAAVPGMQAPQVGNPVEDALVGAEKVQNTAKSAAETLRVSQAEKQSKAETDILESKAEQESIKTQVMKVVNNAQLSLNDADLKEGEKYSPYINAERARLRSQITGADIVGLRKSLAATEAEGASLDLESMKSIAGSPVLGSAALQVLLKVLGLGGSMIVGKALGKGFGGSKVPASKAHGLSNMGG